MGKKKQNIYLVTFSNTDYQGDVESLIKEAENSKLFTKIFKYDENNVENWYSVELKAVAEKYNRGYGYWKWKSKIVYDVLNIIEEGAILLYCDCGCRLNINTKSKKRFKEYIKECNDNGILVFNISEDWNTNKAWTKKSEILGVIKYLQYSYNDVTDEVINNMWEKTQNCATSFFIKKTNDTMKFVRDWVFICNMEFNLINDELLLDNDLELTITGETRHDQSAFSLLTCYHKCKEISYLECWQPDLINRFDNIKDNPIQFLRRKVNV